MVDSLILSIYIIVYLYNYIYISYDPQIRSLNIPQMNMVFSSFVSMRQGEKGIQIICSKLRSLENIGSLYSV